MDCRDVRKAISAYVDGLVDHEESFAIRQHLNTCARCREYLRTYEQDVMALSQHLRRAPYAPVARDIAPKIQGRPSPWWDAFRTGSYRLASVAGLVLVILVVGAGALALREMANTDSSEPPPPETMIGVQDQDDEQDAELAFEPAIIGEEDIDYIIDRLDDQGLVYHLGAGIANDDYTIQYERIAFDRHMTLIEYTTTGEASSEIHPTIETDTGDTVSFQGSLSNSDSTGGWLILDSVDSQARTISFSHQPDEDEESSMDVGVDLSAIADLDQSGSEQYAAADYANGIDLCCLEVERGVAVSLVRWNYEVSNQDELVAVDSNLEPVEDPSEVEVITEAPVPVVTVDDEPVRVLDTFYGRSEVGFGDQTFGIYGLPETGQLAITYEYLTLATGWSDSIEYQPMTFHGPWTLTAQLEPEEADPEPTPEPTPPPDVAQEEVTPTPEATTVPDDDDEDGERLRVLIYLIRGEEIGVASREIPHTQQVATAAMEELLRGITNEDEDAGLHSEIPEGTELLDIALRDGTVTVNLSDEFFSGGGSLSMQMRVAQVVHTLTQFGSIENVEFLVEGQPVDGAGGQGIVIDEPLDRNSFEDLAPAILIESPAPGEVVTDHIRLNGTSNTFEANMQIEIIDPDGNQIYRDYATASSGTGTRGTFDLTIPVDVEVEGWGSVRMFEHSARDGSRVNIVTIPVWFEVE